MIIVKDHRIYADTISLTAVIDRGLLVSLKSKADREEYVAADNGAGNSALELIYHGGEAVAISETQSGRVQYYQVSQDCVEIRLDSWNGSGVIVVSEDKETGDLVIDPSAYSARPGVRSCRWNVKGIRKDLELVAPFYQGIQMKLDDPLIRDTRWTWPVAWEAGLSILQGPSGGFWIHTQDSQFRYKAIKVGCPDESHCLGFETEAYGPIDENLSTGGLTWRLNVYRGDWRVPASLYRQWLWKAYDLEKEERKRKDWIYDIKLAISWCPGDSSIMDALSQKLDPARVLIHFPNWRTYGYDQDYPTYLPNEKAKSFVEKALGMGFHIAPHFNALEIDPTHAVSPYLIDFQYRDIETKARHGWSYGGGKVLQVPNSNMTLMSSKNNNTMIKIHPGLPMWHSILRENIQKAVEILSLDTVFIDVTLNTYNLHNSLVNGITSTQGIKHLIQYLGGIEKGLVLGGEGLNEITMQGLSFAQAHLFKSHHATIDGLERAGGCPLNDYLFGKLCRTIGYSGLNGKTEVEKLRMRIHEEHNTIPTITIASADEINHPNEAIKALLERAAEE